MIRSKGGEDLIFGKHIRRYYLRFGPVLLAGILILVIEDFMMLEVPAFYGMVVNGINDGAVLTDGVLVPFDMAFLLDRVCMPLVWLILLIALGRFLWRMCFFGTAVRVERDLRNRMFDRARRLSCDFYSKNKVGGLMSLFTNDLDTVQECFGWGMVMLVDAVIMNLMVAAKMWRMDPLLTILSLIPMGLLLACATVVGRYMTKKWDIRQEAFSQLSDFSQESFSGIAVIKAFVKEARELMAFKKLNVENEKANMDHTKASVLMRILVTLFVESVICVILGYGGYLVYHDIFNAGQLVEFIGYFTNMVWPIMAVSELIDQTSRGRASLNRISELLDQEESVKDPEDPVSLTGAKGQLRVEDLSFRYPGSEQDVLEHISFTLEAGQSLGIVGKTGAGKTTLVDLLLRSYNVPDGKILLDGIDINRLKLLDLRNACAYVPQDNFLFSDTVENNIAFGMPRDQRVQEAARLADVDGNITGFPKGYQTVLGERGVTVSGGQKQRISIARALIKDAPVLILDDSVCAVDTATERTILDNLQKTRQGKTTILIAHRISTVEKLDKLLYLEEGKVLAVGTHKELLETCPAYRTMAQLQKLEEEGGQDHV